MAEFRLRTRAHPDEVSVAICSDGTMATVLPPEHARDTHDIRDLTLANALHYAGAMAGQLGTDVGVLDDSESVFFIEDIEADLIIPAA